MDKTELFEYLDELRESGVTNMFGATPYIVARFGVDNKEGNQLLVEWMETFSDTVHFKRRARFLTVTRKQAGYDETQ